MSVTLLNTLKEKQAIIIGDQIMVNLPYGNYLLANGNEISSGYNGHKTLYTNDILPIQSIQRSPRSISGYKYADGSVVDVVEYHNKLTSLTSPYYDEDEEKYIYPSLEVEFEVRKQRQSIESHVEILYTEPTVTYTPVEIEIVGTVENTGSVYINNILAFNGKTYSNGNLYEVDVTKLVYDTTINYLKDNNLLEHMQNDNGRNYVRFLKVKGEYMFSDFHGTNEKATSGFMSLNEAKQFCENKAKEVVNTLRLKLFGGAQPIAIATKLKVYNQLCTIQTRVTNLEVKQKDLSSKTAVCNLIRNLITELKNTEE
jgi:hypothetical protein